MPFQRGGGLGSIFRSIFRAILPIAKTAGRAVGKRALQAGAEVASDLVAGRNLKETFKSRGKDAASDLLLKAANELKGGRLGGRPAPKRNCIKGAPKVKHVKRKKLADQLGVYYK